MASARYPTLYQLNTRVWLTELSQSLGRSATLDDIPDAELDRLARMGFDWVWFLSVWQTGPGAQQVSRSNAGWQQARPSVLEDYAGKSAHPNHGQRVVVGCQLMHWPATSSSAGRKVKRAGNSTTVNSRT